PARPVSAHASDRLREVAAPVRGDASTHRLDIGRTPGRRRRRPAARDAWPHDYTAPGEHGMSLDARYWDREFETRPWGWIEAWQAQQLAMMLETLPQRSELYRELLAAAGRRVGLRGYWVRRGRLPTLDMLELLPFTTRDQLTAAQRDAPPGRPLGLQQA